MPCKKGMTLIEIIVVIIIISVMAVIVFPNFTVPTEQARSSTAQNNLLAIYTAQKNYFANNGKYCSTAVSASTCDDIADINTDLSLNINDDGTYTYNCNNPSPGNFGCYAIRTGAPTPLTLTLQLGEPIQLNPNIPATWNPTCQPHLGNANWCPT